MSRDIDSALTLPTPQITARGEIAATDYNGGGWQPIGKSLNTLEHQKRGAIVLDPNPDYILNATGQIARWYGKIVGQTGNTEKLKVRLYGKRTNSIPSPSFQVQASIVGGASLGPQEFNGGSDTPSAGAYWEMSGTLDIVHDAEYKELQLEITTLADMGTAEVRSALIYYERARTEAHAGVYSNGIVPLDVARLGEFDWLSADLLYDCHSNARKIITDHTGQLVTTSRPAGVVNPYPNGYAWAPYIPEGVTNIRIVIRGRQLVGPSGPYNWVIANDVGDSITVSPTSTSLAKYGPNSLTVVPGRRNIITLTAPSNNTKIESLSVWLGSASYG